MSKRDVIFSPQSWDDYLYWLRLDPKMAKKITRLVEESRHDPFVGIGKPEPLRDRLSGFWSRRINNEHRLVYRVNDKQIEIASCRHHYGKD